MADLLLNLCPTDIPGWQADEGACELSVSKRAQLLEIWEEFDRGRKLSMAECGDLAQALYDLAILEIVEIDPDYVELILPGDSPDDLYDALFELVCLTTVCEMDIVIPFDGANGWELQVYDPSVE